MKSKQKRYIRKHVQKESPEEIAKKLGIRTEEVEAYANKCLSHKLGYNSQKEGGIALKWSKILLRIFNFVIFPIIIFLLAFNQNSFHGLIDAVECGQYLSCVNGVFQGKLPFKDFIPLAAGPLFIWVLSATFFIFGKTLYILRSYLNFSSILTYIALYFLACNFYRYKLSAYVLSIVALVETFNPFWSSRWAGYSRFGVGLMGLFFQILYVKKTRPIYLFISGIIASLGFLYSVDSGIFLIISGILLCILVVLYKPKGNLWENTKIIIQKIGIFSSGIAVGLLPFIIYLAINKALWPYLEGTYLMISNHVDVWQRPFSISFFGSFRQYNNNPWRFFISDEFRFYAPRVFYFLTLIYVIFKFKRGRNIIDCVIVPLIAVYGLLFYKSGSRVFIGPQFDLVFLPLLLLSIYFIEKSIIFLLSNRASLIKQNKAIIIVCIFVIVILSLHITASYKRVYGSWNNWLKYQIHKDKLVPYYTFLIKKDIMDLVEVPVDRIGPILAAKDQAKEIEDVTKYIINNTRENEPIFAFPEHSLYNFLADRPAVSRFYIAGYAHTLDKWQEELLVELQSHPPKYIVYSRQLSNLAKAIGRKTELLPEVTKFISDNYVIEKVFSNILIYRKKS